MYVEEVPLFIPVLGLDEWVESARRTNAQAEEKNPALHHHRRRAVVGESSLHMAHLMYVDGGVHDLILVALTEQGQATLNPFTNKLYKLFALGCILPETKDGQKQWVVQQRLLRDPQGFPELVGRAEGRQCATPPEQVAVHYMIEHGLFPQLTA